MTTPTPELLTAEQASEYIRSLSMLPEIDKTQIVRLAESAFHTIIALHEALAAATARADAAEARVAELVGAIRSAAGALDWASRQMKGKCPGSAVNATMLAAGNAATAGDQP